jgi:hypothetical protein
MKARRGACHAEAARSRRVAALFPRALHAASAIAGKRRHSDELSDENTLTLSSAMAAKTKAVATSNPIVAA